MRNLTPSEFAYIAFAVRWTLALTGVALIGGGGVGLLVMFARLSRFRLVNGLAMAYIEIFQSTPLLGQIFVLFYGVSLLGYDVSPMVAAGLALSLNSSAFLAEIWRSCVASIPKPQWEAASSLGLSSFQGITYVIIPQAVRLAIPPTVGNLVHIVKSTSLCAVIGFVEMTRAAQIVNQETFRPLLIFSFVAAMYFLICFPLTHLSRKLEGRLNVGH